MKRKLISIFLIFLLVFTSCQNSTNLSKENKTKKTKQETIKEDKKAYVEILAMGDMIFHKPLVSNARVGDSYDFSIYFKNIEDDIKSADISLANFEGTINKNKALSGFPRFNFPIQTVTGLKSVGFDVLTTANNHCLDTGVDGIFQTINAINDGEMINVGTYLDENHPPKIIEKNNIKIGFLAYTDLLNGMDSLVRGKEYLIDTFATNDVKKDIEALKNQVDFIVVIPHWGNEYQYSPSLRQVELKDLLFSSGADAILGSHPHVVQKFQDFSIDGKRKFLAYSMGNALSNQRQRYLGKKGVESGLMIKLKLEKNLTQNTTRLISSQVIPTYVMDINVDGKRTCQIFKYADILPGGKFSDKINGTEIDSINEKYNFVKNILEDKR